MSFSVSHFETRHHFFVGVPECFIGSWLDPARECWDNSVTNHLSAIKGVDEVCCYGEYSVYVVSKDETKEEILKRLTQEVNKWKPPFKYSPRK